MYEVDPDTVCRCIGKEDKHGNPIFEHDIIVDNNPRRLSNKPFLVEIKDISGGYGYWKLDDASNLEVIRNKFDNTELME